MSYTVFSGYYDLLTRDVDYPRRALYLNQIIRGELDAPALLLDLACGTGSLAIEFDRLGYDVIGVDGSQEMLTLAYQKSMEAGCRILFLHQRMEELDLYGTVDAAVCALDSINHITEPEALSQVFERLALFVRPGGLLVFDANTPYKHRKILGDNVFVREEGPVYCVWQNALEPETDTVRIALDFFCQDGECYRRQSESFAERAYSRRQLTGRLEQAGFHLLAVYEGDTFEPVKRTSLRAVYVARRNE